MIAIDLNPATGDLKIVDRRFQLERRFGYALSLRIRNALSVLKGEWALATEEGFPYYPTVLGVKAPDKGVVRSTFLSYLSAIPGVAFAELSVTLEGRVMAIEGYAIADDGSRVDLLNGNVYVDGVKV